MIKIINRSEGKHLYDLDRFHARLSDEYLSDKEDPQTKFVQEQFLKDTTEKGLERLKLLNISYSIPSLITEKFSDYIGQPITTLNVDLDDYVSAFIWGGLCVFRPKVIDGKFVINYAAPDEYVIYDDGTEKLFTYYEVFDENDNMKTYILEEAYSKNIVTRKLFEVSKLQTNKDYSVQGTQVQLNSIVSTKDLKETETLPKILTSPLVVVHNRKLRGVKYGTSEIKKIQSLISSIEIQAVNIQDQFLKHLQAKLALPISAMKVDGEGKANVRDLEAYGMETGDILPSYITNSNPLIDKAFDQIEDFLRQICAIATLPTEFMGLKDGGTAESADTKRIRLVSFIKKIEKIRSKFEAGFKKLEEIRKAWVPGEADQEFKIIWPSIFPDDPQVLANELMTAQDAKLISNLKAIMKFQGLNEEEALAEQKIINAEQATIDTNAIPN